MKQNFLIKKDHEQLVLFFAGWGMDETPFRQIPTENYDCMICYDYRSLEFDDTLLKGYLHITLVAWSMGVWAASQVMKSHPSLPISQRIAVNGTLFPIDESKGILPAIFYGTLQGWSEQTLQKFQRRMCGSAHEYRSFQVVAPQRPAEELKEELEAIREQASSLPAVTDPWHIAIIGRDDRIFLPQNQRESWSDAAHSIKEVEAAHYQNQLFKEIFTSLPIYE